MRFKDVERKLKKSGWKLVRVCGSHYQYQKENCSKTVTIPNHNGRDLSIGVLKSLEKSTGLSLR